MRSIDVKAKIIKRRNCADIRHFNLSDISTLRTQFLYSETGERAKRDTRSISAHLGK